MPDDPKNTTLPDASESGELRNELSLLSFASAAIGPLANSKFTTVVPDQVQLELRRREGGTREVRQVSIQAGSSRRAADVVFRPPTWCTADQRWRYQLGLLLRFVLTRSADPLKRVNFFGLWRQNMRTYRAPVSHWYQREHGMFNGAADFGDNWVPLSSWMEEFLTCLLAWPGVLPSQLTRIIQAGPEATLEAVQLRLEEVKSARGDGTKILVLPIEAKWLTPSDVPRPLRGCVVQTVIPQPEDFSADPTLSSPAFRKRHRNHLAASLSAVDKMLELRATHHHHKERLDWLILPELAVHPADVQTHLVPFARAHKTIILAGLVYEELYGNGALVNSAIWVLPQRTPSGGVQVITKRQGKCHLAAPEEYLSRGGCNIQSFRPCQWIVNYEWSQDVHAPPLRLTAAICYDATDLGLAADLRSRSDVFAIPAMNQDVNTFDQMALALHYHMFQLVVVANNGKYGGSNAYAPYKQPYQRQIFHLHGQPQASVAFFEIEDIKRFLNRQSAESRSPDGTGTGIQEWKYPPAGF